MQCASLRLSFGGYRPGAYAAGGDRRGARRRREAAIDARAAHASALSAEGACRRLIGLPLLDEGHSTLGLVREVVRDKDGKIELVIGYGGILSFIGWYTRPVAVRVEVIGIAGGNLLRSTCRAANMQRRRPGGGRCCRAAHGRYHSGRAVPRLLYDHDFVMLITLWCLPTCRQGAGIDWRRAAFAKHFS